MYVENIPRNAKNAAAATCGARQRQLDAAQADASTDDLRTEEAGQGEDYQPHGSAEDWDARLRPKNAQHAYKRASASTGPCGRRSAGLHSKRVIQRGGSQPNRGCNDAGGKTADGEAPSALRVCSTTIEIVSS